MTCGSCQWFAYDGDAEVSRAGRCHERPPVLLMTKHLVVTERPTVFNDTKACSQHRPVQVP